MNDRAKPFLSLTIKPALTIVGAFSLLLLLAFWPQHSFALLQFVLSGLVSVAPIVIPGIFLASWIIASGADSVIARAFEGHTLKTVVAASLIGALTPVCGVTVLPLMAGLLAAGIPLAPVMAFWLSSPITDPGMLATTIATLGLSFAVGKTLAAFALGLWGGAVTAGVAHRPWALAPLRNNRIVGNLSSTRCDAPQTFHTRFWQEQHRRMIFLRNLKSTTRLILLCLIPAFSAEYALNATLHPEALSAYVGEDVWWAIPFAVLVGAPAYVDGYAALPLTRGLMDHGMSAGAAMAFLVSGGVVSVWGALAIFPVIKFKPFALYLALAITGSIIVGYAFEFVY